ncbi:MAG: CPBP family intramembrane glutamic endopeptidase [Terriglobales bacterium]
MSEMAVESTTYPAVATAFRRYFVWTQIVVVFLLLELAIWASTVEIRNRWAAISGITILVLVVTDLLMDQSGSLRPLGSLRASFYRLGLGSPKVADTGVVLGIGLATLLFMMIFVRSLGGQIPANPTWFPNLRLTWGYVVWSLIQEFILQSFFFSRFEELYGGPAAVWIAATLFAAVHLPNPILTTATLIGALFFCEGFRRYRSVYPLAIVHAMLGLTIALTVPESLLHHMRVGIGYLRY